MSKIKNFNLNVKKNSLENDQCFYKSGGFWDFLNLEVKGYPDTPTLPEVPSGRVGCAAG